MSRVFTGPMLLILMIAALTALGGEFVAWLLIFAARAA